MKTMNEINSVTDQIKCFGEALKNTDVTKYAGKGILDLISFVVFKDPAAALRTGEDLKQIMTHLPTALFWQKVERFLHSCFRNRDDQIAFAGIFDEDSNKYEKNVKFLLNAINTMEDDEKIDYLAYLTRYAAIFSLDMPLYFRLVKCIQNCTSEELFFLRTVGTEDKSENNAMVSMLITEGMMEQASDEKGQPYYKPSSIGMALKECSLNYADTDSRSLIITAYKEMEGITQNEPLSQIEIDSIINESVERVKPKISVVPNASGSNTLEIK